MDAAYGGGLVRRRGLEPPRLVSTCTSSMLVYQFQHRRAKCDYTGAGILEDVESSYKPLEGLVRYGTRGSIRIDGIVRSTSGQNLAIVDLKFGNAVLSALRAAQIRDALPKELQGLPIIGLGPGGWYDLSPSLTTGQLSQ